MSYQTLITAAQLAPLVEQQAVVVVDCRFSLADPDQGHREYLAGHLPGAVYADLDQQLSSPITPTSGRHPLPDAEAFAEQLGTWGIDNHTQVVAYDSSGGPFAARFWWLMRWVGGRNVAVLDGGLAAWTSAGGELVADTPTPTPAKFNAQVDRDMWLSSDQVADALAAGEIVLVDARGAKRYQGLEEPIDPVAGHVPGAVNLPFQQQLSDAGAFRSPAEIRDNFASTVGDDPERRVVHMCGSGVTACVNLLAQQHAGLPAAQLYAGSWSEWIRDPQRDVAKQDQY